MCKNLNMTNMIHVSCACMVKWLTVQSRADPVREVKNGVMKSYSIYQYFASRLLDCLPVEKTH